jgi:hypothetical protein
MKKLRIYGIVLMCVMGLVSVSCGSDDDSPSTLSVNPSAVSLYYDDTQQLSATGATSWTTENEFVAKVDANGLVTANHIGSANIIASNGDAMGKCTVTVKPKYNCYDTPLLNWGSSKNTISASETHTKESSTNSNNLVYVYNNGTTSVIVQYIFKDNSLYGVNVVATYLDYVSIGYYLLERYQPFYQDDGVFYFIDAMDTNTAQNIVSFRTYKISNDEVTLVTYMSNTKKTNAPRRAFSQDLDFLEELLPLLCK